MVQQISNIFFILILYQRVEIKNVRDEKLAGTFKNIKNILKISDFEHVRLSLKILRDFILLSRK